jgi:hypothetical protein
MVKRLIAPGPAVFRNGIIPILGVGKHRIDIEDHAPEGVLSVAEHLPQMVLCLCLQHSVAPGMVRNP